MLENYDYETQQAEYEHSRRVMKLARLMYEQHQEVDYEPTHPDFSELSEDIQNHFLSMSLWMIGGYKTTERDSEEFHF